MSQPKSTDEQRISYLARAKETEEQAARTSDLETKRLLLQIAESWRLLALNVGGDE